MLLALQSSMGQKENYPALYRSLSSMTDFEAYWELFQYLQRTTSKDFANPNAYYHVGLIMQKFLQESDPFLDTRNLHDYIEQAILYLSLSKRALTNSNFKQYSGFYPDVKPAGQSLTMADVHRDTDERLAMVNEFKERFNESLSYFVRSVNNYNHCITTFAAINQENNRLNDLYFLVDDNLSAKLKSLSVHFDSTLIYLDRLKASLERYPLGGYKINYSLRQIPVYRLYGLNSSDFLSGNTILWDFRTWVDNFNQVLNTEVAFLYKSAEETNKTNAGYIAALLKMNTDGVPANYRMNPLIVNKMLKYDFNSAAAALLRFQEAKVNYLYSIADNQVDDDFASFDRFAKSPDAFLNMVRERQKTDELLTDAKAKATPESVRKYASFFDRNYGGFAGYEKHLNQQSAENEAVMNNALNAYKDRVLKSFMHTGGERRILFNNEPIHLQLTAPGLTAGAGYWIHSKSPLPDKAMLVAGTYLKDKDKTAFAAEIDSLGTVRWLKDFRQAGADSHAVLTAALAGGFAVVVTSPAGDAFRNRILLLDASGNARTTKDLDIASVPQRMVYDEIAQNYVIAFKGNSLNPFAVSAGALDIAMYNARLDQVWKKSLAFDGYVANVVKTDDNYYVYGAYTKLTDESGRQFDTEAGRVNMFVYPVTSGGRWLSVATFDAPFSYYPLYVSKINNEFVDVISVRDTPAEKLIGDRSVSATPHYMIIEGNERVFFDSLRR